MDIIFFLILLFVVPLLYLIRKRKASTEKKNIPPGSFGIPVIGQSLSLLRAMKSNTAEKWFEERARRYGRVSKLSLFGKPTVFIYGADANKFVFTSDAGGRRQLSNRPIESVRMIVGSQSLLELGGEDHKRIRNAVSSFLKPDCLKSYVGKIQEEVNMHLEMHWRGKERVKVFPLMKTLTFNIICSVLFGIERGARREAFIHQFKRQLKGIWAIPINLPFTHFNRSLKASEKIRLMLRELIREKRAELERGAPSHRDLITCLLSLRGDNEGRQPLLSDEEIVDNAMLIMIAGHDTSSALITFIIRVLASDQHIYETVVKEQEEIKKTKEESYSESLTWEDVGNMKLTWRVAMETLRLVPPVFGSFRTTLEDIEYEGYLIPKGWSVFWVTGMTHMDAEIFPEPSKFDPDRFLNPASIPPYCYIPFGGGLRICPGSEFAKIETLVAIHCMVTRFTWKLCGNDNGFKRDPTLMPNQELPIQLVPKA